MPLGRRRRPAPRRSTWRRSRLTGCYGDLYRRLASSDKGGVAPRLLHADRTTERSRSPAHAHADRRGLGGPSAWPWSSAMARWSRRRWSCCARRCRFRCAGLIPLRLLEEIRSVQYHLAALAAGQTTHVPRAEGNLSAFLAGLVTAWQHREVRTTHRRTPRPARDCRTRKDPFESAWPCVRAWLPSPIHHGRPCDAMVRRRAVVRSIPIGCVPVSELIRRRFGFEAPPLVSVSMPGRDVRPGSTEAS